MAKTKADTTTTDLDQRLGAPMKKSEGLSSDKKRSEAEHLHAYREDVDISNEKGNEKTKE